MSTLKSAVLLLVLNLAFAVSFLGVQALALSLVLRFDLLPFGVYPRFTCPAVAVLTVIPAIVSAAAVGLSLRVSRFRNLLTPITRSRALLIGLLIAAFLITFSFGAPAVATSKHMQVVALYKNSLKTNPRLVGESHPYFRTWVTVPIAPCVLVSYSEGVWAGRGAFGEFVVHVWYGRGVKQIWRNGVWGS